MEIYILRAAELLCTMYTGRRPSSGLADQRFTVHGDNNYLSVRVWPGFEARRVVVLGDKRFDVFCCAQESLVGRVTGNRLESGAREETGRFRDVKRCVATEDRTRVSGISLLRHNR